MEKENSKIRCALWVSQDYEWIICYARSEKFVAATLGTERKYYETPDFPNRPWRIHDLTKQTTASDRPNSFFAIINPKTAEEYPANPNRTWAITKETFNEYYLQGRIVFPGDYSFLNITRPAFRYWKEDDMKKAGDMFGLMPVSTKLSDCVGMSLDGTKEITELMNGKIFSFLKTVKLTKFFVDISTKTKKILLFLTSSLAQPLPLTQSCSSTPRTAASANLSWFSCRRKRMKNQKPTKISAKSVRSVSAVQKRKSKKNQERILITVSAYFV